MQSFYITFGQKYRTEEHPCGGHPDGYFRILAPSEEAARNIAFQHCGNKWSGIYDAPPSAEHYPLSELGVLV